MAIVSGLWLSDVAGKLLVPRPRAATRYDWKFVVRALLRYAFVGLAAFGLFLNDPRFADTPMILETEKSDDMHEDVENLRVLRGLVE